ncbi:thioesterase II family protein [Streptosporangium sp. OZ121]|uniref:thioesterase II family protein n=1 Tax=Streptosporangium sp. OZ121 TaxID=3444183 RepID=UPI003F7A14DF
MTTTRVLDRAARAVSFPAPRPRAAVRLFCLPYAGGGSVEYQQWADLLPDTVEVVPVHLPGRERRFREAPHTVMAGLVTELACALAPHLGRPYALFGYSMGAWVAFELARELRRRGAPAPLTLLAAAAGAPDGPRAPAVHDAPDGELVAWMRRLGGSGGLPLDDPRLLAVVLPRVRADLRVTETYLPAAEAPLECPLVVYTGDGDEVVSPGEALLWGPHTAGDLRLRVLGGGHFFLHERRAELLGHIIRDLEV